MFQFTLPCRERHALSDGALWYFKFQFTLPCRERRKGQADEGQHAGFQFTLPCRERRAPGPLAPLGAAVSIHAPV